MSFLQLNGCTIPVVSGGLVPQEIGARGRAFDGSPLISRRAIKRKWRFTTPTLDASTYRLVRTLVLGQGQLFFHNSEDIYSTKGVPLSGDYTGTYTSNVGSVGGESVVDQNGEPDAKSTACAQFSNPYENDVSSNVATGGDTNGDATGFSGFSGTVAYSTTRAWRGAGSILVNPTLPGRGCYVALNTVTLDIPYFISFYVYVAANETIGVQLYGGSSSNTWVTQAVTGGQWTRVVVVDTLPSPNANPGVVLRTASGNDFYVDGFMAVDSWNGYESAPWIDGTLVNADTGIDPDIVADALDLTFACWFKSDYTGTSSNIGYLVYGSGDGGYFYARRQNISTDLYVALQDALGASTTHTETGLFADGEWHHLAIVMRRTPAAGENGVEIYIDGTLEYSSASYVAPDFAQLASFGVGGNTFTSEWHGALDEPVIFPAAMSAEMVTWLQSNNWGALPKLKATGDFVYDASVDVVGKLIDASYLPSMRAGTFAPESRAISFELEEV